MNRKCINTLYNKPYTCYSMGGILFDIILIKDGATVPINGNISHHKYNRKIYIWMRKMYAVHSIFELTNMKP